MSLKLNENNEFYYNGKKVGEHIFDKESGQHTVRLNIEYVVSDGAEWVVPLSWFSYGLKIIEERERPLKDTLIIETSLDSLDDVQVSKRFLIEVLIKQNGYQWQFHKNDADPWPSKLHGHHKHLVLDAKTGKVYDSFTRDCCYIMKEKELKKIQKRLLASKDFAERASELFGEDIF